MKYLTYEEYKEIGGTLEETAFKRNIDRASGIITSATHGRIERMQAVPVEAKALCRDIVEYLAADPTTEKAISGRSQSAGGVSESESYTVRSKAEQDADIDTMLCDHLLYVRDDNDTPLLYRGCAV